MQQLKKCIQVLYYNNYIISLFALWWFLVSRHLSQSITEIYFTAWKESLQYINTLWYFTHKKVFKSFSQPLKHVHRSVVRIAKEYLEIGPGMHRPGLSTRQWKWQTSPFQIFIWLHLWGFHINPLTLRNSTFNSEQLWILSLYCFIYSQKYFCTKIVCCVICQSPERESEQDLEINLCWNIHDVDHLF